MKRRGVFVALALLGACGEDAPAPFLVPSSTRGTWNAEQAAAFWRQNGELLARLVVRLDGVATAELLGGPDWLAKWMPKGLRVLAGSSEDLDSDRVPARFNVNLDDLKDEASGLVYAGRYRLSDPDDMNVFSGYSLEFNGLRIDGPAAMATTLDGHASLVRRADSFANEIAIRIERPEARNFFMKAVIIPDDMKAPERKGKIASLEGFLEPKPELVLSLVGENIVYDWHCGAPPIRSGAILLKDGAENSLKVNYEDCREKDPVFASKS